MTSDTFCRFESSEEADSISLPFHMSFTGKWANVVLQSSGGAVATRRKICATLKPRQIT